MLRHDLKRKRRDVAAGRVIKVYSASSRPYKKRRFQPGVDRTGGYYGRYAGRNAELKFHDVDLDDPVIAGGGTVTPTINIIPQGVKEDERVGRKCVLKSIYWNGTLDLPIQDAVATSLTGDMIRLIVYQDHQCNGATATDVGILETADIDSFRNLANQQRFTILYDKVFVLNYLTLASDGAGVVSQAQLLKRFKFYKKCNIPIEYDNSASTGVLTTIRTNNLGVLVVGQGGKAQLTSKFRLRFSDGG